MILLIFRHFVILDNPWIFNPMIFPDFLIKWLNENYLKKHVLVKPDNIPWPIVEICEFEFLIVFSIYEKNWSFFRTFFSLKRPENFTRCGSQTLKDVLFEKRWSVGLSFKKISRWCRRITRAKLAPKFEFILTVLALTEDLPRFRFPNLS